MSTPPGKYPFDGAPDVSKAFEQARDNTAPKSRADEQQKSAAEAPQPRLRPTGPMRGMAGSVDRMVSARQQASENRDVRKEMIDAAKTPRRVTQLARDADRQKDKDRGRS